MANYAHLADALIVKAVKEVDAIIAVSVRESRS